jgi:hypothetical protein
MKKIVVLLLLMVSANVFAEWTFIGNDDEGTVSSYVDLKSTRKKGKRVKMWDLMDWKKIQGIVNQGNPFGEDRSTSYLSSVVYRLYDCEEETSSIIEAINYSGQMGSGTFVGESFPNGAERIPVAPRTLSEGLLRIACDKK